MAQRVKDLVLPHCGIGCSCSLDSIPGPGTSISVGVAIKEMLKKKFFLTWRMKT